jgi:hypothetical protein
VDEVVALVVEAISNRDWDLVRRHLHPYLHWHADETQLRGRTKVIEMLMKEPTPGPPSSYELRDGQVYRWHSPEARS